MGTLQSWWQRIQHSTLYKYGAQVCALVLFLAVTFWGARSDFAEVRESIFAAECFRLKSHADRTVGRIESYLEADPVGSFATLPELKWLRLDWNRVLLDEPQRLYTALVDVNGRIIKHSDPQKEGHQLEHAWYIQRLPYEGFRMTETQSVVLADGRRAYDLQIPVVVQGRRVGNCHIGMAAESLDSSVRQRKGELLKKWLVIAGLMALTIAAATLSVIWLIRESTYLKQSVALQRSQRLTELGRLAGGLAHEIRNPLNAIRLNLFTLQKQLDRQGVDFSEHAEIFKETDVEIDRLESLIRSVLGYARPQESSVEETDLTREIKSTVGFIEALMEKDQISLQLDLPHHPAVVRIDRDRLRQMMLNLLNNAREASGQGGKIEVRVSRRKGWADIEVSDSGPGISETEKERVFEPFYTTKETGTGLGLALVKRFGEEANGYVSCMNRNHEGATFQISLPLTLK